MFLFHHWFFLLSFGYFHRSLHFFISPTLGFFDTLSSVVFISPVIFTIFFRVFSFHQLSLAWLFFVRYFVFVLLHCECYGFESVFFLLSGDFYLTLLPHICHSTVSSTDFRELFLVSDVNLHSFQTFDTTCFYQCFPRSRQFLLEGCRASHWSWKHTSGPSVCGSF